MENGSKIIKPLTEKGLLAFRERITQYRFIQVSQQDYVA